MEDRTTFAPFLLLEYPTGGYGLVLFDGAMEQVEDVFVAAGAEANGHGWEALAESVVRHRFPDSADDLHVTSEAGTFAVDSESLDALRKLGGVLHSAFHDRALLSTLVRDLDAEPDDRP